MGYKSLGNHVFAILLALLELNDKLGEHHVGEMEDVRPILESRRKFSRYLINNPHLRQNDMTP